MKLISKIADIDGEIQELVHQSKLPVLNKLLDKSNDLYIERIAELEKELDELNSASDELYGIVFNHIHLRLEFPDQVDHTDIKQLLEAHNLEQRIAGMEEVATQKCPVSGFVVTEFKARDQIINYADFLRNQAKALKEGK
jgi:hypothetical protein